MSVCGAARCRWLQTRSAVSLRVLQQNRTVCGRTTGASESIREKLQAFPGGSIDLQKRQESGIAVLTVNNPARMNAFSGTRRVFTPHMWTIYFEDSLWWKLNFWNKITEPVDLLRFFIHVICQIKWFHFMY